MPVATIRTRACDVRGDAHDERREALGTLGPAPAGASSTEKTPGLGDVHTTDLLASRVIEEHDPLRTAVRSTAASRAAAPGVTVFAARGAARLTHDLELSTLEPTAKDCT